MHACIGSNKEKVSLVKQQSLQNLLLSISSHYGPSSAGGGLEIGLIFQVCLEQNIKPSGRRLNLLISLQQMWQKT